MIRKTSETRALAGNITSAYNDSQTSAYSTEYINNMNTYSTDEVFTGKYWVDSKPIYRKVFTGTITSTTLTIGQISNIDNIINISGISTANGYSSPLSFYWDTNLRAIIQIQDSTGDITVSTSSGYSNKPYKVMVEYTKTTD